MKMRLRSDVHKAFFCLFLWDYAKTAKRNSSYIAGGCGLLQGGKKQLHLGVDADKLVNTGITL